jgi:hypothetical protein
VYFLFIIYRALEEVEVNDISLVDFIAVKGKHATFVSHTAGRYQRKAFRKAAVIFICMLLYHFII